jgi:hypothetical protein
MAGGIASFPGGVQSGLGFRAASALSTNSRVLTGMGPVMLVTDVMIFVAETGTWLIPNQRVFVNGVPTIGQTSIGSTLFGGQAPVTIPMTVVQTDGRVFAM